MRWVAALAACAVAERFRDRPDAHEIAAELAAIEVRPRPVAPVDSFAEAFPRACGSALAGPGGPPVFAGRNGSEEAHALYWWCRSARDTAAWTRPWPGGGGATTSFVTFKAARTGSEWFSETLAREAANVRVYFEPMSKPKCTASNRNASRLARPCLATLLRGVCRHGGLEHPRTIYVGRGRCMPCGGANAAGHAVRCPAGASPLRADRAVGVALNPGYFDDANWWAGALRASRRPPRIILLRRTNLVRMALSKYRHGGLLDAKVKRVGGTSNAPVQRIVDAEKFALGLRTYCIKQQAYAASIAAHVAYLLRAPLAVVLYEDLAGERGDAVYDAVFAFLGSKRRGETRRRLGAKQGRLPLCDEQLANCDELTAAWRDAHPCLYAQLLDRRDSGAWTAPRDFESACEPLPPLAPGGPGRVLADVFFGVGDGGDDDYRVYDDEPAPAGEDDRVAP